MTFASDETHTQRIVQERTAELEAQIAQLQKELAEKQLQLECVRHLVTHDLRAPLRTIDGFSRILSEEFSERVGEEGQSHLGRISRSVTAMARLLEDALTFLRPIRSVTRREIDLSALADQACQTARQAFPNRNAEITITPGLFANADEQLCRALLDYLFENAWKFTAGKEPTTIEFGAVSNDSETAYFVKDNGAGFDMQFVHKLFQPFQRLHSASQFPGHGIGLAMAYRIVSHHHGRIWAEAAVDQGTTIFFTLGPTE